MLKIFFGLTFQIYWLVPHLPR